MSITVTPGYTWVNGEVETATKLNLTATPTIAGDQTYTFNNGAAATPSINFAGSTTTGLFYSATGVGISAAGTQYAFLNSNGLHLGNDFSTSVSTQFNIFQTNGTAQITLGQDSTHSLNFRWDYNATPASAAAVLTTFSQNNPLTIQASAIAFDSTSLANAVQILGSGRVRVGGGADDGSNAFQVNGAVAASSGIRGTTTNNNAAAGAVGEVVSSTVLQGSAVSLTTAVVSNVTSISLTAGDWDVFATNWFVQDATTVPALERGSISTTSATIDFTPDKFSQAPYAVTINGADGNISTIKTRISLAITTTVYLCAMANFTVSTMGAYGTISARRTR